MTNLEEVFVDVEGFKGYKIGNYGTLLGKLGKPMRPSLCNDGYLQTDVQLNGKSVGKLIHRLVAEHFVPKPNSNEALYVDHIDNDRLNNRADNLQWVTHKENIKKSTLAGRRRAKLKPEQVVEIRGKFLIGKMNKELAEEYQVSFKTIWGIRNGSIWADVV
ncbi:HNH endonuclease [Rufibacter immobilis]|uniref:HNH endonuclease n=1 Tax=Rufibacter immobilis TaxID=1348778 RepID=A0A3M9N364_9BACT|nr:HNH endonuclease signature motif containing protein [Rufibacter immobilis]RNI32234.1 HNH endonuclease [Rufibacter immobilis]